MTAADDTAHAGLIAANGGKAMAHDAAAAEARRAQHAHTELVEQVMLFVDILDDLQREGERIDIAALRPRLGKVLRRSAMQHAEAIAALVADTAPSYANELIEYSISLDYDVPEGAERGDDDE
jgi:ferric-dicitrate binding protein FerR (iron transport regulator)